MVRATLFLLLLLICMSSLGQGKGEFSKNSTDNYKPIKYSNRHNYFNLTPAFQFGNQAVLVGFTKIKSKNYLHGYSAKSISLDLGFLTKNNIYMSAISLAASSFVIIVGGNLGLKGLYYWQPKGKIAFAIRPEVGIVLYNVTFNYGYDIFLNKTELPLKNHNFTVSISIPLLGS